MVLKGIENAYLRVILTLGLGSTLVFSTILSSRFHEIESLMREMANNYRLLNTETKLCFIPEPGIDLAKFNSLCEPLSREVRILQSDLEIELDDLRNF